MQQFHQLGPHVRATLGTVTFSSFNHHIGDIDCMMQSLTESGAPCPDLKTLHLIHNKADGEQWWDESAKCLHDLERRALRLAQELDYVESMFSRLCAAQESVSTESA